MGEPVPTPPLESPMWPGDTAETLPSANELISQVRFIHPEDQARLLDFYSGRAEANRALRPRLTINLLPALVALAAQRHKKEHGKKLTREELALLAVAITARNRDPQRFYNAQMSNLVELVQLRLPQPLFVQKGPE